MNHREKIRRSILESPFVRHVTESEGVFIVEFVAIEADYRDYRGTIPFTNPGVILRASEREAQIVGFTGLSDHPHTSFDGWFCLDTSFYDLTDRGRFCEAINDLYLSLCQIKDEIEWIEEERYDEEDY